MTSSLLGYFKKANRIAVNWRHAEPICAFEKKRNNVRSGVRKSEACSLQQRGNFSLQMTKYIDLSQLLCVLHSGTVKQEITLNWPKLNTVHYAMPFKALDFAHMLANTSVHFAPISPINVLTGVVFRRCLRFGLHTWPPNLDGW